jgi:hypothetical protein
MARLVAAASNDWLLHIGLLLLEEPGVNGNKRALQLEEIKFFLRY